MVGRTPEYLGKKIESRDRLLSAIGIAGMDRLLKGNVLAMSGRAVEAAGDVDVLLLDKMAPSLWATVWQRNLCRLLASLRRGWPTRPKMASLADETPEG